MTVTDVVLHLGMGKTGSSSLQVAFVRNRDRLARLGIRYPEHRTDARAQRGQVVSGNGLALQPYLAAKPGTTAEEADAALEELLAEVATAAEPTVLYSSEFLFYFEVDRLRTLHAVLAERGVRLRAVMYVRDVAGHALSSYAQEVKRSLYTDSLTDYLRGYALWPEGMSMGARLQSLVEVIGADSCVVIHYDSVRKELLESFMAEAFGVHDLDGFDLSRETVNRSLTAQEVEWMRYLNGRFERPLSALAVSDQIIQREPLDPRRLVVTREEVALLAGRFAEEVAWINQTFLPDGRLSVGGGADVVDEREPVGIATDREQFLLDCLAGLGNAWRPKQRAGGKGSPVTSPVASAAASPTASADAPPAPVAAPRPTPSGRIRRRVRSHLDSRRGRARPAQDPGGPS